MWDNHSSAIITEDFDIETYRDFVKSKIQTLYFKKSSITENQIIDYCSQFVLTVKEFFPAQNQSTTSEKLRKAFGSYLINKPKAVSINTYLLFNFGYIYCNTCNSVLRTQYFYKYNRN